MKAILEDNKQKQKEFRKAVKKVKLFQRMEKLNNRSIREWNRLHSMELKWEAMKEKLEKKGLWKEFCEAKRWVPSCTFMDLGS